MPRTQTNTEERVAQNRRLVEEVAIETGEVMTIKRAAEHRRKNKTGGAIPARDIDFGDDTVAPIGVVLAAVDEYKVLKGGSASLRLITDAREFGEILHDAARISQGEIVVAALYYIPRDYGLDLDPQDPDAQAQNPDAQTPTPTTPPRPTTTPGNDLDAIAAQIQAELNGTPT